MTIQKLHIKKVMFNQDGTAVSFMEWAVAMAVFQNIIGNVVSFYLTLGTQIPMVRWGVNWTVNGILFLLVGSCFVICSGSKRTKIIAMLWTLFVVGIYVGAVFVHPAYIAETVKECLVLILQGGTLAMIAWLFYMRVVLLERVFYKAIIAGAFLQPVYSGMIITFFRRTSTDTDNFGTITYLEIAYSALTLLTIIFYYFGWASSAIQKGRKMLLVVAALELLISSVTIGVSGSRGALVGVAFLLISLFVMGWFFKGSRKLWLLIFFSGISVVVAYNSMPETSVSKIRVENDYTHYEDTLTPEQLKKQEEASKFPPKTEGEFLPGKQPSEDEVLFTIGDGREVVAKKLPDGITKTLCDKIGVNQQLLSIFYENSWEIGGMGELAYSMRDSLEKDTAYGKELGEAVYSVTNGSAFRLYLWMAAVYELEMNHGKGMAPFGYHLKYNNYAHNIWVEAYAEFGVIGGTIFLFITLLVLGCAIWEGRKKKENAYFLAFIAMCFTQLFLSGNLYGDRWLCFLMATGAISIYTWKKNLGKKEEVSL